MLKRPENKVCADCKRNDPRWASTNLGCFMCIRCSGIHRGMGVHITRIKSVDLDTWTPEQIANIQRWGNRRANAYWEAHLKPGHMPPEHKIESFIRSKYELKRWAMDGPIPAPETLDGEDNPETTTSAPAPTRTPAQSRSAPTKAKGTATTSIDLFADPPSTSSASAKLAPVRSPSNSSASTTQGSRQQQQVVGGGLFDLDMSSSGASQPAAVAAAAPKRDAKADIMSLFSVAPPSRPTQPVQPEQPPAFGGGIQPATNGLAGLSLGGGGSSGNDLWGAPVSNQQSHGGFDAFQSFTATPAAKTSTKPSADLFGATDVWGSSSTTTQSGPSTDSFGDFGSAAASSKPSASSDAFSDIWK
ncbi:ARF GAP with effector function(s) [Microbotryomycetes sp. JL201]|nr:ARF GAP with effector function(s) [Microbotryomycetes sp. JL201]